MQLISLLLHGIVWWYNFWGAIKKLFPEFSKDKAFLFQLRNSYLGKFQLGYLQPVKDNDFIL